MVVRSQFVDGTSDTNLLRVAPQKCYQKAKLEIPMTKVRKTSRTCRNNQSGRGLSHAYSLLLFGSACGAHYEYRIITN